MILKLSGKEIKGQVKAPDSKSAAHRLLIASYLSEMFSESPSKVNITESSKDIEATLNCIEALKDGSAILPCNESGSTYRFMVPLACALRERNSFHLLGRLPERPMSPLFSNLRENGMIIEGEGQSLVTTIGKLQPGKYTLPGNISSQFITGLLMALPILDGDSIIEIEGVLQSESYINITLSVLSMFGIKIEKDTKQESGIRYMIYGNQKYHGPADINVEGDWSNAAFYLAAGAIGKHPVTVTNLSMNSMQGDKKIIDILREFGANVNIADDEITVFPSRLSPIKIDVSDIPDLVPVLSLLATQANGTSEIYNAARLRLKESDRLKSVTNALSNLGAIIDESEDSLFIHGTALSAGTVSSENDHRIAMMSAIASVVTDGDVVITGAEAVSKSYPSFYRVFEDLGGKVSEF